MHGLFYAVKITTNLIFMAEAEDYIRVYESSDGGSGNPVKTFWQFFVGEIAVTTDNHFMAETIRLSIKTRRKVKVTYDDRTKTISQVRIEFDNN